MKIHAKDFKVKEGAEVDLKKWPACIKPFFKSKDQYLEILNSHLDKLKSLQSKLYAQDRYSILVIFQAMDAAGKDSAIKHVMSGLNPQGCQVYSFKHPSAQELDHDFLWRSAVCLPERGRIGIFNRSYYEEVLIVKVHPEILRGERLPQDALGHKKFWEGRYKSILDFEKHLQRNGTHIIKFFLHLSKEEQRKRFLARLEDPDKNWKFNEGDLKERACWKAYMKAYEDCLSATSTDEAPWYVVPADDKENARLIISHILLSRMKDLDLCYPKLDKDKLKELAAIRKKLLKDA